MQYREINSIEVAGNHKEPEYKNERRCDKHSVTCTVISHLHKWTMSKYGSTGRGSDHRSGDVVYKQFCEERGGSLRGVEWGGVDGHVITLSPLSQVADISCRRNVMRNCWSRTYVIFRLQCEARVLYRSSLITSARCFCPAACRLMMTDVSCTGRVPSSTERCTAGLFNQHNDDF